MIAALDVFSVLPVLKKGIFFGRLLKPMLIDMPGSHGPDPLYLLTRKPVVISTETKFVRELHQYANAKPVSALERLLVTSGNHDEIHFFD
ncbi:MAG TPA: hypothetical protein VK787_07930 [Puia sp.]|jgi:hypothetical protein|nr:hypothetical protein [Puia sp.]